MEERGEWGRAEVEGREEKGGREECDSKGEG